MTRPSWSEYFRDIAQSVSTRASCPRAQVGAVAVRDNRVLVTGYNGAPPGLPHCLDAGCLVSIDGHCARTVHAEANLVATAARYGIALDGATVYVYVKDDARVICPNCEKLLLSAGAKGEMV